MRLFEFVYFVCVLSVLVQGHGKAWPLLMASRPHRRVDNNTAAAGTSSSSSYSIITRQRDVRDSMAMAVYRAV